MFVHNIKRALLIASNICYFNVQTFLIKLIRLTTAWRANIKPHILKKSPGGVTYKMYLFETSTFFIPKTLTMVIVAASHTKLKILMIRPLFP